MKCHGELDLVCSSKSEAVTDNKKMKITAIFYILTLTLFSFLFYKNIYIYIAFLECKNAICYHLLLSFSKYYMFISDSKENLIIPFIMEVSFSSSRHFFIH